LRRSWSFIILFLPRAALATGGLFSEEPLPDTVKTSTPAIEAAPSAPLEDPSFAPRITWAVRLGASVAVDTSFDRRGEQIFELGLSGALELHADLTDDISAHVLPRFAQVTAVDREGGDRAALYMDVPEAYLTLSRGILRLRAGTLVHAWGSANIFTPSDILNPVDLRRSIAMSRDGSRIPVLGVEATLALSPLVLRAVVQPFFTSSRFYLAGWDSGFAPLVLQQGAMLPDLDGVLGRATADRVGDELLVIDRPNERPDHLTLGLRATVSLGDLDLSTTFVWGYEPLPRLAIDPDFSVVGGAVLDAVAQKRPIDLFDPTIGAALGRLQDKLGKQVPLIEGSYPRRTVFGIDASWALDPVILIADATYTLSRTHYTQSFAPIGLPAIDAVVGVEYVDGETFQAVLELFSLVTLNVPASVRLAILEPRGTGLAAERTVFTPGAAAAVRYTILEGELSFEALLAGSFTRNDLVFAPQIKWRASDAHSFRLGGVLIEGKPDGYGGAYTQNDQLIVGYEWTP